MFEQVLPYRKDEVSMTIKELKRIVNFLPDETVILVEQADMRDVECINVQVHSDGRVHLVLSSLE